jgi:hypothetical protein
MKVESISQGISAPVKPPKNKQEAGGQRAAEADQTPSAKSAVNASRQALNVSIVETSMAVSLSAGNNSLSLLFKSAIEHLNSALAPDFGANAIQSAYDSGVDVSPQATADRIVSMSTAFFGKYLEMHPEKDLETALNAFAKIIGDGIDQGFAEARKILDGLRVLQGDIASNIDKTYELVQSGLKSFVDYYPRPDKQSEVG